MFPPRRHGLVQATFALTIIMGPTTIAPALQGWITDTLSWSWIFILNLPVGALGVLAILGGIEAVPDERRTARFDGIGVALLAIAMACLVFGRSPPSGSETSMSFLRRTVILRFVA